MVSTHRTFHDFPTIRPTLEMIDAARAAGDEGLVKAYEAEIASEIARVTPALRNDREIAFADAGRAARRAALALKFALDRVAEQHAELTAANIPFGPPLVDCRPDDVLAKELDAYIDANAPQ